ncbi:hypothetical protein BDZ91DRAFT_813116 [Kalaharituber pfeilii]|nr:hypothetical protein BDZ91DRAFT_813116 [Kalaharituber pfeilii]
MSSSGLLLLLLLLTSGAVCFILWARIRWKVPCKSITFIYRGPGSSNQGTEFETEFSNAPHESGLHASALHVGRASGYLSMRQFTLMHASSAEDLGLEAGQRILWGSGVVPSVPQLVAWQAGRQAGQAWQAWHSLSRVPPREELLLLLLLLLLLHLRVEYCMLPAKESKYGAPVPCPST